MEENRVDPPSLITMQIRDIQKIIDGGDASDLNVLDLQTMENGGYVTRERLGPPKPKAPWFPEGRPVTSKQLQTIGRLLSENSSLTFVPAEHYASLTEFENKIDYTNLLKEIRSSIMRLLITFIEFGGERTAKMRIYDDLKSLVKETWTDVEQLIFRVNELSDMFRSNIKNLCLSFNDLMPTYRETQEVRRAMAIETSFQANFAVCVGTCFLAGLHKYNETLKKAGAKDPSLRFQQVRNKQYEKKKELYYLSDKLIENLAFTAYILNIGLYHRSMNPVLDKLLSETPPTPEDQNEIRRSTYEKTLEIIQAHTILDLPVGMSLLRTLIADYAGEDDGAGKSSQTVIDPIIIEILKVSMDYFTLTAQRPYRERYNRSQAIEFICCQLGGAYHLEAAASFFNMLQPFTPGEMLILNDNKVEGGKYLIKVLGYSENPRHPLFRSLPLVRILEQSSSARALPMNKGVVDLAEIHLSHTQYETGEQVYFGGEKNGPLFRAEVVDPETHSIKILRCVTRAMEPDRIAPLIGRVLSIKPGNPERRLWKCHAPLCISDTVPTQMGEVII